MKRYSTLTTSNAGKDVEQQELSFIANGNAEWYKLLWKTVCQFPKKLNMLLTYDPDIVLLAIYPKELRT